MKGRHIRSLCVMLGGIAVALSPAGSAAAAPAPSLQFSVVAHTGLPLGDILWTGNMFVYTLEGHRTIFAADAHLSGQHLLATVPRNGGEMRCVLSPGSHGFPAGFIYCHASGGQIDRISLDGRQVTQVATVPSARPADGALTFDSGGAFGYALLAATGGSDSGPGGTVFAIQANGNVQQIGTYAGPGGAENIAIAPPGFGAAAGQVLITIDKHDHLGRLLAMDAHGSVHTLVQGLTWGLNPIAPIVGGAQGNVDGAAAGLYVADWLTHDVFFASAEQLKSFAGGIFLGTERHGFIYLLQAQANGYRLLTVTTNLHAKDYNFEGAKWIAG